MCLLDLFILKSIGQRNNQMLKNKIYKNSENSQSSENIFHILYSLQFLNLKLWEKENKMMVEDLGVEAKEAAVREVAKLLPLPELLQSISTIKADYITRQQAIFL